MTNWLHGSLWLSRGEVWAVNQVEPHGHAAFGARRNTLRRRAPFFSCGRQQAGLLTLVAGARWVRTPGEAGGGAGEGWGCRGDTVAVPYISTPVCCSAPGRSMMPVSTASLPST